jgi:hypothetical protein
MKDRPVNAAEGTGAKEEIRKALVNAMKRIVELLREGAVMNVYLPEATTDDNPDSVVKASETAERTIKITKISRGLYEKQRELKKLGVGTQSSASSENKTA